MRFDQDQMRKMIHSYLEFPGKDFDEDNYEVIDKLSLTKNLDELTLIYGMVCGEFVRQGMMKVEDI